MVAICVCLGPSPLEEGAPSPTARQEFPSHTAQALDWPDLCPEPIPELVTVVGVGRRGSGERRRTE